MAYLPRGRTERLIALEAIVGGQRVACWNRFVPRLAEAEGRSQWFVQDS